MKPSKDITIRETRDTVPYKAPEWAKHVVWYQIFPERFRNGDPSNDPVKKRVEGDLSLPESWSVSAWTGDWYKRSDWEKALGARFRDGIFYRRYGGDLQGIIDKLDYLEELGVGALYLNPVFDAVSLHKYDTSYYHHVDRFFGPDPEGDEAIMEQEDPADPATWQWTSADRLYLELIGEVHKRDMKIICDGVFNHTGTDFWAFRDIMKNRSGSRFKDWYEITSFGDSQDPNEEFDYKAWWGVKDLPELKAVDHNLVPPVKEHIFAITRRWMDPNEDGDPSDGIDGWRLDVPEEVGQHFWKEWCSLVKELNPDAFIVGEIWTDNAVNYISREQFDAVMNYRFAAAVQDYMIDRDIPTEAFRQKLQKIRKSFPKEANYVMQNLMDSHDTPRLASMIVNPGRKYDNWGKPKDGFKVRKPNKREREIQKLIALLQYTYVGAPMIYYGTEAGMWGADDPDDRKPMIWPDMEFEPESKHPMPDGNRPSDEVKFDRVLFEWYKKLGALRNSYELLRTGAYRDLEVDQEEDLFAFVRYHEKRDDIIVVILNRAEYDRSVCIDLSEYSLHSNTLMDLISSSEVAITDSARIQITLEAISGAVFIPKIPSKDSSPGE